MVEQGETNATLTPALKEVRKALDRKNMKVPISGPDWTDLPVFDEQKSILTSISGHTIFTLTRE